jgi:hypothetical protein
VLREMRLCRTCACPQLSILHAVQRHLRARVPLSLRRLRLQPRTALERLWNWLAYRGHAIQLVQADLPPAQQRVGAQARRWVLSNSVFGLEAPRSVPEWLFMVRTAHAPMRGAS